MRTIIELPQEQLDALDAICRQDGISRAEAIRRAVGTMVGNRALEARSSAFGLWRGPSEDGVATRTVSGRSGPLPASAAAGR